MDVQTYCSPCLELGNVLNHHHFSTDFYLRIEAKLIHVLSHKGQTKSHSFFRNGGKPCFLSNLDIRNSMAEVFYNYLELIVIIGCSNDHIALFSAITMNNRIGHCLRDSHLNVLKLIECNVKLGSKMGYRGPGKADVD